MRAFRMRLTRDLTALMFEMEGTCPTATRNENNGNILPGALAAHCSHMTVVNDCSPLPYFSVSFSFALLDEQMS